MFFTNSSSASVCDFRKDVLEKGRYKPNRLFYKDAFYLVERFRITFSSHFVLQNMTKNEALIAERDAILAANPDLENYEDSRLLALGTIPGDILQSLAACKWLKENTALWEDLIIPDSFIFDEIEIVFYKEDDKESESSEYSGSINMEYFDNENSNYHNKPNGFKTNNHITK